MGRVGDGVMWDGEMGGWVDGWMGGWVDGRGGRGGVRLVVQKIAG